MANPTTQVLFDYAGALLVGGGDVPRVRALAAPGPRALRTGAGRRSADEALHSAEPVVAEVR